MIWATTMSQRLKVHVWNGHGVAEQSKFAFSCLNNSKCLQSWGKLPFFSEVLILTEGITVVRWSI